jgi:hypothetical protein
MAGMDDSMGERKYGVREAGGDVERGEGVYKN